MKTGKLEIFVRVFFISIAMGLLVYIFYSNIAPFGSTYIASTDDVKNMIQLTPPDRIINYSIEGQPVKKQVSDVVYFSTKMPYNFDTAKVKITFLNPNLDQPIFVGYQDQPEWHYNTKLIDFPLINNLVDQGWKIEGEDPSIYYNNSERLSVKQLLSNPPKNKAVGIYNLDKNIFRLTQLENYKPTQKSTIIDTPLRGKIVFYVYVKDELFKLKLWKQDLNLYEEPDIVKVKVYKEDDVVYETQIDDDGIVDNSGKVNPPQHSYIQNPGPGLPETGVYKVVIETGGDTVITKMETNLHKIVFDSPLYPISNHEVYPKLIKQTSSNIIFSDAQSFSAITFHDKATQEIKIGQNSYKLDLKQEIATYSTEEITRIELPKSDVVLKGVLGNFAFSQDQFFQPTKIKLLPITTQEDIYASDYIIANYKPSRMDGQYRVAQATFELNGAYIKNRRLSWIIKADGIKLNGKYIYIKNVEIEFSKRPLIKL